MSPFNEIADLEVQASEADALVVHG